MIRRALIRIFDPFGIIRNNIVQPLVVLYEEYTESTLENVREVLVRLGVIIFVLACVFWAAILCYVTFYYSYMPQIAHMRPVYMQYKTCDDGKSLCTYPAAHVSLTKRQQLLMVGQPYKVFVNLEMPESVRNKDIGMFLVCAELRDQGQNLRSHACRSTMLRYKSTLLTKISTWILSPLNIFGIREEKQTVNVELFSDYLDEKTNPVTNIYVEIQNSEVQFYDINLQITAQFKGLRYFMFHWPVISSIIGITTNLILILLVLLLSWYHWSDTKWIDEARGTSKKRSSVTTHHFTGHVDEPLGSDLIDDDDMSGGNKYTRIETVTSQKDPAKVQPITKDELESNC